jgi:succinyl-diaminopimelate desuccinylase
MINAVNLSQDLIKCPSVTPKDEGAQQILIDHLNKLGFECHELKFGNILNFFARKGTKSPHFCFCGHTDVVPAGDPENWRFDPFSGTIDNGILYGRGAVDMKSNIAAFISALSIYMEEKSELNGSISLLITGDEEAEAINGTVRVLEWMKQTNNIPDACLVGEPTNPNQLGDEVKIGRRGSISGQITVTGKQGHTGYPHLADNPIPKLVKLVDALANHKFDEGSSYFEPSALSITTIDVGNPADNVIPEKGSAKFNMRFNDHWSAKSLEKEIKRILDEVSKDYQINFWSNAESFITEPGPLSETVINSVKTITGKTPRLSTAGGTSDARFISNYCPVIECGLVGKTCHQTNEHTPVKDIETLVLIYKDILHQFFSNQSS